MRKEFSEKLKTEIQNNKKIVLITGDLGYRLWDDIKHEFPDNFINPGSSEQLMLGMATGIALEGKIPICYSITPFLLYRPFEFIRNYMNHDMIPIKLVGGGRGKQYGSAGYTHWCEEDQQIMGVLHNINSYYPESVDEMLSVFDEFLYGNTPSYINLKK